MKMRKSKDVEPIFLPSITHEEDHMMILDQPTVNKIWPLIKLDHLHTFQRLFYVIDIPDYGHSIRDSGVKKCFDCGELIDEV